MADTTTDQAHALGRALFRATRRMRGERGRADLPEPQYSVLAHLHARGTLTPGQLAELERVQPPSMTRTVNCLTEAGFVAKQDCPADGRQVLVALTPAGRTEVAETRRRRDLWLADRLAELSDDERADLARATDLLLRITES